MTTAVGFDHGSVSGIVGRPIFHFNSYWSFWFLWPFVTALGAVNKHDPYRWVPEQERISRLAHDVQNLGKTHSGRDSKAVLL